MIEIVSREVWRARESSRLLEPLKAPAQHVFVMNTHTKTCRNRAYCHGLVRRLQHFHVDVQRKSDIRYNFMIGGDAVVYEGRGWNALPDMPASFEAFMLKSIIVAYVGTYTAKTVPLHMAEASVELLRLGIRDGLIAPDFEYHDIMVEDIRDGKPNII